MTESVDASLTLRAPLDAVLSLVHRVESYPQWQQEVREVVVDQRDEAGRAVRATFGIEVLGRRSVDEVHIDYSDAGLRYRLPRPGRLARHYVAEYVAAPSPEGTLLQLMVELDVVTPIPGTLLRGLMRAGAQQNLQSVRRLVEAPAGRSR